MSAPSTILLAPEDNVVVATLAIAAGDALPNGARAAAKVDAGHKIAIRTIRTGEPVVKYAQAIGRATADIAPGDHVHSHNLAFDRDRLAIGPQGAPVPLRRPRPLRLLRRRRRPPERDRVREQRLDRVPHHI